MGKRKKPRRSRELWKYSPYSQPIGVRHEYGFKVDGSSKNRRRKRQKMRVKKLFEKGIAIVPDERLSMSMSGLNISVADESQTKARMGGAGDVVAAELNSRKDAVVFDELNSTDDVIIIETNPADDVIVIDDSRDINDVSLVNESIHDMVVIDTLNSTSDFIVIDEFNSTNDVSIVDVSPSVGQQLEGGPKEHFMNLPTNPIVLSDTKAEEKSNGEKENITLINEVSNEEVLPVDVQEVFIHKNAQNNPMPLETKEIACKTKENKPQINCEKQTKYQSGKQERAQPLSDATNSQRVREQFPKNGLFHEMLKVTQKHNTKSNNEYACMLEEYKSWRANSKNRSKNNKTKCENNQGTDVPLQNLNTSHLENLKSSLEKELYKETVQKQKQYTVRESYVPEPDMNASMEQYGRNYYAPKIERKTKLRPIYIDGSNVAFGYTQGRYFSVTGLKICIDYFLKRGHEVHAFVPHFRKNQCSNPLLFEELIKNGLIITTPSRYLNGKNLTPYDDRYIVKCAAVNRGVIVSCDNYRDLIQENAQLRPVIEKRLLMPMWVNGMLMFPDDPLGRHGPNLEQFLQF